MTSRGTDFRHSPLGWTAAAIVVAASLAMVWDHARGDSASMDEPVHILAGCGQVFRHDGSANIEHPPFVKELAGWGVRAAVPSVHLPRARQGESFPAEAHRFLFYSGNSPDALLEAGRAPMLLLFFALLALTFLAGRRAFGTGAGLLSLTLIGFSPNFLAHAGIVQTDVGAALFWLSAVLGEGLLLQKRSTARVILLGLALGLSLATKFSAVLLFPTLVLVVLAARAIEARDAPGNTRTRTFFSAILRDLGALALASCLAVVVTLCVYWPAVAGISPARQASDIALMVGRGEPHYWMADRIAALGSLSRPLAQLLGGIAAVWRHNQLEIGPNYFLGRVSRSGFFWYFPVAFLLKSTIPFLMASLLAAGFLFTRRLRRRDAVLWVPVLAYFGFSMPANYNIGIRHLLPVYPLLAIAAGELLARGDVSAGRRGKGGVALGAALVLAAGQIASAVASHPYELSYFNPLAGGSAGGIRYLSDSNLDWGLDLRRLAAELKRRGVPNPTVAYFGGDDVYYRLGVPDFIAVPRLNGDVVAISATLLCEGPQYWSYYGAPGVARNLAALIGLVARHGQLVERIGGSIYVFRLRDRPGPSVASPSHASTPASEIAMPAVTKGSR